MTLLFTQELINFARSPNTYSVEAGLIVFYKIINGLAQVTFEGFLIEAYKGTRRKHNMKFRQIGQPVFFPKTISAWNGLAFAEAPSLAVFR